MDKRTKNFIGACLALTMAFALWPTVVLAIGHGEAEAAAKRVLKRLGIIDSAGNVLIGGTIGGSLGSTDNAIVTADGTGGATAQGTTATLDAGVLDLTATGALALGTGTNDPRLVKGATDFFYAQDGSGNDASLRASTLRAVNLQIQNSAFSAGCTIDYDTVSSTRFTNNLLLRTAGGQISLPSAGKVGFQSSSAPSSFATADTALSRDSAGRVLVENGSGTAADLRLDQLLVGNGATGAGNLAIYPNSDTNTGVWFSGSDAIVFEMGGAASFLQLDSAKVQSNVPLRVPSGSVSAVAIGISSDADTGLFGTANSSVSTAIGGTTIATVGTVGVTQRSYPEAITGNYTVTNAQSGQVFTNTGAGGAVEVELDSISATGISFTFVATDNQDVTLDPGSSDKFVGLAGGWADGEAMLIDDQNDAVKITRLSTGDWLVEWTRGTLTEESP